MLRGDSIILAGLMAVLLVVGAGCGSRYSSPQLTADEAEQTAPQTITVDLGAIAPGGEQNETVFIENRGSESLELSAAKTSCECVSLTAGSPSIPAGERVPVRVVADMTGDASFTGPLSVDAEITATPANGKPVLYRFKVRLRADSALSDLVRGAESRSNDCGPACMYIVARLAGQRTDFQQVTELCEATSAGTSLYHLELGARRLGFSATAERLSAGDLRETLSRSNAYGILWLPHRHFVVVSDVDGGRAAIIDPDMGPRVIDYGDLETSYRWTGELLLIQAPGQS